MSPQHLIIAAMVATSTAPQQKPPAIVMLETSAQPATLGECERRHRRLGRPTATISRQDRTNEPWQHRHCIYKEDR